MRPPPLPQPLHCHTLHSDILHCAVEQSALQRDPRGNLHCSTAMHDKVMRCTVQQSFAHDFVRSTIVQCADIDGTYRPVPQCTPLSCTGEFLRAQNSVVAQTRQGDPSVSRRPYQVPTSSCQHNIQSYTLLGTF